MKKLVTSIFLIQVCLQGFAQYDSLTINNINAGFHVGGYLFNRPNGEAHFEVPIGSTKHTIYGSSLWIGGLDINGQLHFSGSRFRQDDNAWSPGPISNTGDCDSVNYNRIWKNDKGDLDLFRYCIDNPNNCVNYQIPSSILEYPGNGDVSNGYDYHMAPFVDTDNDGVYNPLEGDYPKIWGDESLFYVFNDQCVSDSLHDTESLGVEIKATAYSFDCDMDSSLYNSVFVRYEITNKSNFTYYDTYVALFSDLDLGQGNDDFIASDVMRGAYYVYNGDYVDGTNGPSEYGEHPPAQAVVVLGGPWQDDDNLDNPIGIDTNQSLSGVGYGDGIADNERLGLSKFVYFNNDASAQGDPQAGTDYYNYMKGIWKDNTPMVYGGNGHINNCTSCEPASYMYPDTSDLQYYWGTNGTSVAAWSEETALNAPGDRRGVGSVGPFTMEPGEVNYLDLAFVFGRDFNGGPKESVAVMKERIDAIRQMFVEDSIPLACGGRFSPVPTSVNPMPSKLEFEIFPNPANDYIQLSFNNLEKGRATYSILDITGKIIQQGLVGSSIQFIDLRELPAGVYALMIEVGERHSIKKFIKK